MENKNYISLRVDDIDLSLDKILENSVKVVRKEKLVGSLENEETAGLDYWVVDGNTIYEKFPEIIELKSPIQKLILASFGVGWFALEDKQRQININVLNEGQRYEKHVDGCSLVAIYYPPFPHTGGELEVQENHTWHTIKMNEGDNLVLLKGSTTPHQVLPVTSGTRISIPFAFQKLHEKQDSKLNDQLF